MKRKLNLALWIVAGILVPSEPSEPSSSWPRPA
jgi:hypothetical protein